MAVTEVSSDNRTDALVPVRYTNSSPAERLLALLKALAWFQRAWLTGRKAACATNTTSSGLE